jgi:acyl carrier protein
LNEQEITSSIVEALNEILTERGIDTITERDNMQLFGEGSAIDSLDLVTIVVQVEEAIRENTGNTIEVVDENSVISDVSPFRTVSTLAAMIKEKLDAQ